MNWSLILTELNAADDQFPVEKLLMIGSLRFLKGVIDFLMDDWFDSRETSGRSNNRSSAV